MKYEIIENMLSLLSLNVLCSTFFDPLPYKRIQRQAQLINDLQPDILCLQEFNNMFIENIYTRELSDKYLFYIDRVTTSEMYRRAIIVCVYWLLMFRCGAAYGIFVICHPFFLCFITGTQKTGNAVCCKKNLVITDFNVVEFKNQYGDFLNIFRRRGYIEFKIGDILIKNVHLNFGDDQKYLDLQMKELLVVQYPQTLLLGDFNTTDTYVIANDGFVDEMRELGNTHEHEKRIDYVFQKGVDILEKKKMDLLSDHHGLFIRFSTNGIV
jgi:endonuclease/exonuclease/phosphatase family metal-dependent hydrolase